MNIAHAIAMLVILGAALDAAATFVACACGFKGWTHALRILGARAIFRATRRIASRPPDFTVGSPDRPYLQRWWLLPRNPVLNVYLHQFLRDDDDRALHDHPWDWCSVLLKGGYCEHTIDAGG